MLAYTDYPILELGDASGKEAPIREVNVLSYDTDKYCVVLVEGILTEIKAGYLYRKPIRLTSDPEWYKGMQNISTKELPKYPAGLNGYRDQLNKSLG